MAPEKRAASPSGHGSGCAAKNARIARVLTNGARADGDDGGGGGHPDSVWHVELPGAGAAATPSPPSSSGAASRGASSVESPAAGSEGRGEHFGGHAPSADRDIGMIGFAAGAMGSLPSPPAVPPPPPLLLSPLFQFADKNEDVGAQWLHQLVVDEVDGLPVGGKARSPDADDIPIFDWHIFDWQPRPRHVSAPPVEVLRARHVAAVMPSGNSVGTEDEPNHFFSLDLFDEPPDVALELSDATVGIEARCALGHNGLVSVCVRRPKRRPWYARGRGPPDADGHSAAALAAFVRKLWAYEPALVDAVREFVAMQTLHELRRVGARAFSGCSRLREVRLPRAVTCIDVHAFAMCSRLAELTLPDALTHISSDAFHGCTSLRAVRLPDRLVHVGARAFQGCTALRRVALPGTVTHVGMGAFERCTSLAVAVLPAGRFALGSRAFDGCASLATVDFGGVVAVGEGAFCDCGKLAEVALPLTLRSVGVGAFARSGLTRVTLPDSVTHVGDRAFDGCGELVLVMLSRSLVAVGAQAFRNCARLGGKLAIPDTVESVGAGAFEGCVALMEVVIPTSVTRLNNSTFRGCVKLRSVSLPDTLRVIGSGAFMHCSSLATVLLPGNLSSVGFNAFHGCHKLDCVVLPDAPADGGIPWRRPGRPHFGWSGL